MSKRSKPAAPLEASWQPDLEYGKEKFGFTEKELWKEAEKFRNHAAATGRQLSSWDGGWRNWVIKAAEFNGKDMKVDIVSENSTKVNGKKYYFKRDDPRFEAWIKHTGKSYPVDRNGGWYFDDEWPPGVNPFV